MTYEMNLILTGALYTITAQIVIHAIIEAYRKQYPKNRKEQVCLILEM